MPLEYFHTRLILCINVSYSHYISNAFGNTDRRLLDCKICPHTMHKLHIAYLIKFNFIWNIDEHFPLSSIFGAYVRCTLMLLVSIAKRTQMCISSVLCVCVFICSTAFDSIQNALCLKTLSTIRVFDFKCFKLLIRFTFALHQKHLWLMISIYELWPRVRHIVKVMHPINLRSKCSFWLNRVLSTTLEHYEWPFDCKTSKMSWILENFKTIFNDQTGKKASEFFANLCDYV